MKIDEQDVLNYLIPVEDPELGYSIVELGLVRGVAIEKEGTKIGVMLTLTSPMCPMGPEIVRATKEAVSSIDGVQEVAVDMVWSPPWDPRIDPSEEIRADFGIW